MSYSPRYWDVKFELNMHVNKRDERKTKLINVHMDKSWWWKRLQHEHAWSVFFFLEVSGPRCVWCLHSDSASWGAVTREEKVREKYINRGDILANALTAFMFIGQNIIWQFNLIDSFTIFFLKEEKKIIKKNVSIYISVKYTRTILFRMVG